MEIFSYSFMINAFIVGILIAVCCALLGVVLVLKRYSMIGDGLSHVGFGALSIAAVLNFAAPLYVALPVVVIAAYLLLRITEKGRVNADAAIALISSSALAIGVFVTSINGTNIDLQQYMFGSILAVGKGDIIISAVLTLLVLVVFVVFYNKIFVVTFDEPFARATGIKTSLYNITVSVLTAVTVVVGMRMLGTLLISALIIFPALTSMRLCKRFKTVVISSVIVSVSCVVAGLFTSYYLDNIPVGATIVIYNLSLFLIFMAVSLVLKAVRKK